MPQRAVGRHRRPQPRHRTPQGPVVSARGRAVALSAALSATLLTGVTAGNAAISATPLSTPASPSVLGQTGAASTDATRPGLGQAGAATGAISGGTALGRLGAGATSRATDDGAASGATLGVTGRVAESGVAAGATVSGAKPGIAGSGAEPRAESGVTGSEMGPGGEKVGRGARAADLGDDLLPARRRPRGVPEPGVAGGEVSAVPVRRKPRPAPERAHVTGAAWVNPNPAATVTSCFGPRWGRIHEGVDLAAADGSPILAAGAGVVVRAGAAEGYGNAVLIDHGDGFLTHYGHLSAIGVRVGQRVAAGEQIGNEGSTGHSTGPHLHFEVHLGFYQNPIEPTLWMHEHGVDIHGCGTF